MITVVNNPFAKEKSTHSLPFPHHETAIHGDTVLFGADEDATPTDFTITEYRALQARTVSDKERLDYETEKKNIAIKALAQAEIAAAGKFDVAQESDGDDDESSDEEYTAENAEEDSEEDEEEEESEGGEEMELGEAEKMAKLSLLITQFYEENERMPSQEEIKDLMGGADEDDEDEEEELEELQEGEGEKIDVLKLIQEKFMEVHGRLPSMEEVKEVLYAHNENRETTGIAGKTGDQETGGSGEEEADVEKNTDAEDEDEDENEETGSEEEEEAGADKISKAMETDEDTDDADNEEPEFDPLQLLMEDFKNRHKRDPTEAEVKQWRDTIESANLAPAPAERFKESAEDVQAEEATPLKSSPSSSGAKTPATSATASSSEASDLTSPDTVAISTPSAPGKRECSLEEEESNKAKKVPRLTEGSDEYSAPEAGLSAIGHAGI